MRPESEEALAGIVRAATGPLRVTGGGTRALGGPGPGAGPAEVLETGGLTGVVLYEPASLTLVAKAGTRLDTIEAVLAAERQRLAFEPPRMERLTGRASGPTGDPAGASTGTSTLGGVVAANAAGPRRIQAGAARDALLGVRFVDGRGQVIRNGGRVMKNVTGYDLVKLMAGSRGTLGVLTEVSFKLQPIPPAAATLILPDAGAGRAVAAMTAALGSPYDVTGAAYVPGTGTLIRVEGLEASVDYRAGRLAVDLAPLGVAVRESEPARVARLWRDIGEVAAFHDRPGAVWRVSCRPSEGAEVARRLGGEVVMDWGGGLVWALWPEGEDIRPRLAGLPGHATLVRGFGAPALPPEPEPVARLSRALKAQFDPRGLFAA
ncbi:FAD-binding protein [Frigidibacter sp. MR17.24]|uniref:FAD-binding protein n=1 Tax=Frigidibacter sp. MR17.24 TaxID=3127345 RepID=UPI003012BAD2